MSNRFGIGTRRAALDGLGRILDAGAPEDLFTGSDEDAVFVFDLLVEVARGRSSACYWEICRTARRRGVSPEYVVDRAAVLLSSIEERRRIDAYRILGVEPLASAEAIRHRWLEFAKHGHPDVGGEVSRFRRVKEAYELLRDPQRRADYERYWLRALGPIERVVPADRDEAPLQPSYGERRLAMVGKRTTRADEPSPSAEPLAPSAEPPSPEPPSASAEPSVADVLARVRGVLSQIDGAELAAVRERLDRHVADLEGVQRDLASLARAKAAIGV
jgi:hypothetical protein